LAEGLRRLAAVVGAVDLDRGQLAAGVLQLLGLRQALRIEHPAPRLEGPAADADIDLAAHPPPIPLIPAQAGTQAFYAKARPRGKEAATHGLRNPSGFRRRPAHAAPLASEPRAPALVGRPRLRARPDRGGPLEPPDADAHR